MTIFGWKNGIGDITEVTELPEFDNHVLVSFAQDEASGLTGIIAIHRANLDIPSFGATRFWHYGNSLEGIKDALRLSRLMSYKAAVAGLDCGGAKGVILSKWPLDKLSDTQRTKLIEAYASRVNLLGGRFVTGTDVGIQQSDLHTMRDISRHVIGFNNNSTEFTVFGVFESMKAALQEVFGSSDPSGHSFAIQGLGKIGGGLLALLYGSVGMAGKIYITDINPAQVEKIRAMYPRVIPVAPEEIDMQEVDVFVPCALSCAINAKNAKRLRVKIVVGGANNQLDSDEAGDILHEREILYVPDYVANAGGLIAVFDEYRYPSYDRTRVEKMMLHIPETLRKIFIESRAENVAPNKIANRIAERIFNSYHVS